MNTHFINRPATGFILSVILMIATSAFSYYSVRKFFDSERWVDHTNTVRGKLESIISGMKDAETGQRGYLLTGNELFLEPYNKSESLVRAAFDTVKFLTADNQAQQAEFKGLKVLIDAKYQLLKNTIDQKRIGGRVDPQVLLEGKSYMDQARTTIIRMENREEILLSVRLSRLDIDGTITLVSIVIAFLISLLSTLFFYKRTLSNYQHREQLQQTLELERENLERRISIIKEHAQKIGQGEYGIQIDEDQLRSESPDTAN